MIKNLLKDLNTISLTKHFFRSKIQPKRRAHEVFWRQATSARAPNTVAFFLLVFVVCTLGGRKYV